MTPTCEGALAVRGSTLYFSNPSHAFGPFGPASRLNMTVHASRDGGDTWPTARVYWPGAGGYSSLLPLADGHPGAPGLGVVFENAFGEA